MPLAHGAGAGSPAEGPARELPAPREPTVPMSNYKVYRSEGAVRPRFGRIHWKIVLATAGAAFVIAVGALTLPELLFGSSVSGSQSTTFFGGPSRSHSPSTKDKTKTDEQKTTTDKQKTTTSDQQKTTTRQQGTDDGADAVDAVALRRCAAAVRATVVAVDDANPGAAAADAARGPAAAGSGADGLGAARNRGSSLSLPHRRSLLG